MGEVCHDPNMSVFSQCSSKPADDLQAAIRAAQSHVDAEFLCTLGFLKNISGNHQEQLDKMEMDTGRKWTVYEITATGRAMFGITTSSTIH
jgi:hypothetical protein